MQTRTLIDKESRMSLDIKGTGVKTVTRAIVGISALISLFLVWFIYFKAPADVGKGGRIIALLPALNATLNTLSATCLVSGFIAIRRGKTQVHKRFMVTALVFSGLFLVSYLLYHHFHGDTQFTGTGLIRPIYFFILITHIVLSIVVLPMVLITVYHALRGSFTLHRRIARVTFPVWLYVSVTGVLVFLLLNVFNYAVLT